MTPRRGGSLMELMVALILAGLTGAAASGALVSWGRSTTALVRLWEEQRRGYEALLVLRSLGSHIRYVRVVADTAVDAEYRILVGVTCSVGPTSITLAPARSASDQALTFVQEAPVIDDRFEVYDPKSAEVGWAVTRISSVRWLPSAEGCGAGSPFLDAMRPSSLVLQLGHAGLPVPPMVGVPLEVYREIRLVAYLSSASEWTLGWRHCPFGRCRPVQPITVMARGPRHPTPLHAMIPVADAQD